ncbi:MAG: glycosyltransferase family 9 protein [Candidatus Aminicenantes bacterium]|nr:glycosyltransferase family 9 protein [Candidatus Aminicenantes bacterium]
MDSIIPLEDRQSLFIFRNDQSQAEHNLEEIDLLVIWLNKPLVGSEEIIPKMWRKKSQVIIGTKENKLSLSRYFLMKTAEILEINIEQNIIEELDEEKLASLSIKKEWLEEAENFFLSLKGCPYAVIHPGSGGHAKRWPLENFLKLVNIFADMKINGVFITGPAEESYCPTLSAVNWPIGWFWINQPSLTVIAALLAKSTFYIGNDSGITHLAALCGCPGLAFYKKENIPLWLPYSRRIKVIEALDVGEIGVELVCQEIKKIFEER